MPRTPTHPPAAGLLPPYHLIPCLSPSLPRLPAEEDKAKLETAAGELKALTDYMKKVLGDRVEKVSVSARLTDSPAVVVASKFGWSANMERIMRAQVGAGGVDRCWWVLVGGARLVLDGLGLWEDGCQSHLPRLALACTSPQPPHVHTAYRCRTALAYRRPWATTRGRRSS